MAEQLVVQYSTLRGSAVHPKSGAWNTCISTTYSTFLISFLWQMPNQSWHSLWPIVSGATARSCSVHINPLRLHFAECMDITYHTLQDVRTNDCITEWLYHRLSSLTILAQMFL